MEWNGFDSLDLTNVEAGENFLKAGQFRCEVTKAAVEPTKNNTGLFVKVELKCLDGNGVCVDRFNVKNQSEKAVEIGLSKLKKFLIEADHPNPDKPGDISSLVGLKIGVNLTQGEPFTTDTGEVREGRGEIAGYFKQDGVVVAGPAPVATPQTAGAAPSSGADTFPKDDDIPF